MTGPLLRRWQASYPIDVRRMLAVHRRGYGDPAFAVDAAGAIWRACQTPDGPGTLRLTWRQPPPEAQAEPPPEAPPEAQAAPPATPAVTLVRGAAWGPGAGWLLDALPAMLGALDQPESFVTGHPLLSKLARRHRAIRIGRTGMVFDALVPAVLEQKVVGAEATRAWRTLLRRFGEPAPGPVPAGLTVPPPPEGWTAIPSWEWHRAGVEAVRARTIIGAARVASRLAGIPGLAPGEADRKLQSLPGIGPWTSAEIRQRACGDADAVSVGDYHLPTMVGWALAGHPVDDAGMLELLAPFAGHRHRAATLLKFGGIPHPRRGPRLNVRDYRRI